MTSITQQNLATIYPLVNAHLGEGPNWKKDYGRMAKRLPGLIHVSGLAQAVLFVRYRHPATSGQRALLNDLALVLNVPNGDLTNFLRTAGASDYLRLVRRAQDALVVFKRLSVSVFELVPTELDAEDGGA